MECMLTSCNKCILINNETTWLTIHFLLNHYRFVHINISFLSCLEFLTFLRFYWIITFNYNVIFRLGCLFFFKLNNRIFILTSFFDVMVILIFFLRFYWAITIYQYTPIWFHRICLIHFFLLNIIILILCSRWCSVLCILLFNQRFRWKIIVRIILDTRF